MCPSNPIVRLLSGIGGLALGMLIVTVLPGCGDPGFPELPVASGSVTLDGEPMKNGFITFVSQTEGGPYYSANIIDGEYSIQVPTEPMQVQITSFRDVPGKFTEEIPGHKVPVQEQFLPERFNTKSTFTADPSTGLVFDFKVESK